MLNPVNGKSELWDKVSSDLYKSSFILHEVFVIKGINKRDIEQKHHQITPLDKFGKKGETIWVTGLTISKMISPTKVTNKYIFDDAVIIKSDG